ncbi:putative CYC2-like cyclin [Trypanosoma cruzi]|uniref:CYC2-like cyclin, putative n=2 Tax=Trypanosoma cruzi TaxID=5693 RepID=Q4DWL9_TRYCC|nr:CYC2-like cyclin, putative [Trypanosoma cruzi]EAN96940.1 CYC2-like cyclin, putative [Trypanosoma cruzi]PWV10531.1 putative CYC2-like cyclin [Trypanosoma cruzi]RNC61417.1 putative CYC2-like cyclin, putative,cyclin 6 [Trypanosoma cruzi]|eukprot:XP_818791.1 CYC2-like cyclin [Trypanosoma cruzi strain CL Brener]
MNSTTLREVSNLSGSIGDVKQRLAQRIGGGWGSYRLGSSTTVSRSSLCDFGSGATERAKEMLLSPRADRYHADDPVFCNDLVKDITVMYMEKEKQAEGQAANDQVVVSPKYLTYQPEINEKMRMILVDWLIDVHLKFKLHSETMYLAVNILDRYLSCVSTKQSSGTYVARSQLQLVGITAILLAAKYEEIWPPEVKECVHISANTYTREEVIKMERSVCAALSFRLTVPTPFPFIVRLLSVMEGLVHSGSLSEDYTLQLPLLRHTALFFLEHGMLDYKCLRFKSSQQANASLFLALVTLRIKQKGGSCSFAGETIWTRQLQHYSRAKVHDFKACAEAILEFVNYVPTTKYQAVRRKYSSAKYGEVAKLIMPNEVPDY